MSDTNDTPPPESTLIGGFREHLHISMDAIDKMAALGAQAQGVNIGSFTLPPQMAGLPSFIPIGLVFGEKPEFRDVSKFAEAYRLHPARKKGTAKALTLASFIGLVNRHKTPDTAVFASTDWQKPGLQAVIDYHEASSGGIADFCEHKISYDFPFSEDWKTWTTMNGVKMSQIDFAQFVEDNIFDVVSLGAGESTWPERYATSFAEPAQLMTLSKGLEMHRESRVREIVNLGDGSRNVMFEDINKDADGKPLKLPGGFCIAIAPFFMGEAVRLPVRLRYKNDSGKMIWHFQIIRPEMAITERVRDDLDAVRAATSVPCFEGFPEA